MEKSISNPIERQVPSFDLLDQLNVWFTIPQRQESFTLTDNEGTDRQGGHIFTAENPIATNEYYNNGMYYGVGTEQFAQSPSVVKLRLDTGNYSNLLEYTFLIAAHIRLQGGTGGIISNDRTEQSPTRMILQYYYGNVTGRVINFLLGERSNPIREPYIDDSIILFVIRTTQDEYTSATLIDSTGNSQYTLAPGLLPISTLSDESDPSTLTLSLMAYTSEGGGVNYSSGIVVGCGFADTVLDYGALEIFRTQLAKYIGAPR